MQCVRRRFYAGKQADSWPFATSAANMVGGNCNGARSAGWLLPWVFPTWVPFREHRDKQARSPPCAVSPSECPIARCYVNYTHLHAEVQRADKQERNRVLDVFPTAGRCINRIGPSSETQSAPYPELGTSGVLVRSFPPSLFERELRAPTSRRTEDYSPRRLRPTGGSAIP
jgi:hypothetical protein